MRTKENWAGYVAFWPRGEVRLQPIVWVSGSNLSVEKADFFYAFIVSIHTFLINVNNFWCRFFKDWVLKIPEVATLVEALDSSSILRAKFDGFSVQFHLCYLYLLPVLNTYLVVPTNILPLWGCTLAK